MNKIALSLILALGLTGTGISALMTWHHDTQLYGTAEQQGELIGCTESSEINCDIVNTSEWSELGTVPIATLGMGFYLSMAILAGLALRGQRMQPMLMAGSIFAVGLSGLLYYISKTELGYLCAWCFRLYGLNLGLLVLSSLSGLKVMPDRRTISTAAGLFAALMLLVSVGERGYRQSLGGATLGAGNIAKLDHDPTGKLKPRTITVTTEDGQSASFDLEPDDAWKGKIDAKVIVVEFADLECGYCKRASAEMSRLYEHYGDRVLFVFKHFPMSPRCNPGVKNDKHRDACDAARASVCAQQQGHFWSFHDLAFKNQHKLDDDALFTYASVAGVSDMEGFKTCFKDPASLETVRTDASAGAGLGIKGTPRIFIDGKLYRSGTSAEAMARAIEVALGADPTTAAQSALAMKETKETIADIPADVPLSRSITYGDHPFSIDTFEASIKDEKAYVGKHEIPALRISWFEAKAACEAAGKRLCTESEWLTACQGATAKDDDHNGSFSDDLIEGTAYPYGDYHEDGRCWDAHDRDGFRPVYTGEMPGCATHDGVYDMSGNVEEWVGDSPEHAALLGGAWDTPEDHARCYRNNDTFGPGYGSPRTGFRCCSN